MTIQLESVAKIQSELRTATELEETTKINQNQEQKQLLVVVALETTIMVTRKFKQPKEKEVAKKSEITTKKHNNTPVSKWRRLIADDNLPKVIAVWVPGLEDKSNMLVPLESDDNDFGVNAVEYCIHHQRAPLLPPTLIHSREVWHFTQSERELKSADEATTVYQRMMHPPIFYQFKQSNTKYLEGALYHSWFGLPCIYHPTPGQQLSISVTCLNKENQKYTTANIQVWALESEELQDTACKLGKVIEGKNISKCRRN